MMMVPGDAQFDLGSVRIHKKVLADIIATAVEEIDGVHVPAGSEVIAFLSSLVGRESFHGIRFTIDESRHVTAEIPVVIRYGMNIHDIAAHVQDVAKEAVEKTANIRLKDVHINIQGIERGEV